MAFSTGFHVGDALYRDLVTATSAQHWHTGVDAGFSVAAAGTGWIQASDQANDSSFIEKPALVPEVVEFSVYPFALIFGPSIWFRIRTEIYPTALVRLTVRRPEGPWHFVVADDPHSGTLPLAFIGPWRFLIAPANISQSKLLADELIALFVVRSMSELDVSTSSGSLRRGADNRRHAWPATDTETLRHCPIRIVA